MARTPKDWAAIARAYADETIRVQDVCGRFGVSLSGLYRRARKESWPRRLSRRAAALSIPAASAGAETRIDAEPAPTGRRALMVARLYKVLEDKMRALEDRIARSATGAGGGVFDSPIDGERDARTLNALVRLFAKLNEMEDGGRAASASPHLTDYGAAYEDAERLRRDIASRLARLREGNGR